MAKNLFSLGLLRNGKVYANKQQASQSLIQDPTNDGVAKLARYLGSDNKIKTLVGFYANADEMEENSGGTSYYTILDIEGESDNIQEISSAITTINQIIGTGITDTTLTNAINEVNNKFGDGISVEHTVTDALEAIELSIVSAMTVSIEESSGTSEYSKIYTIKQGGEIVGTINIPKDIVIKEGTLVRGYWNDDVFTEDEDGPDSAIKLVLNNDECIYINTKDLIEVYTAGDGIEIIDNAITVKYNQNSEGFLIVDSDGIRVEGIQAAIDAKADAERLYGSDGISIASNRVKAVASKFSFDGMSNPIIVDGNGIKFTKGLDCGYLDSSIVIPSNSEEVNAIVDTVNTDIFLTNQSALEALGKDNGKEFKTIGVSDTNIDKTIELNSRNGIVIDGLEISGTKDNGNGKVRYSTNKIEINNIEVKKDSTVYNVFDDISETPILESFIANNVIVDDISLGNDVFNIYKLIDNAVISIGSSKFNLNASNSNILRISNYSNATGVTVEFKDVEWTYENSPVDADFEQVGLLEYRAAGSDSSVSGDLTAISTWNFKFINCKYNGVKVNDNNFDKHKQVFYTYGINGAEKENPVTKGFNIVFE